MPYIDYSGPIFLTSAGGGNTSYMVGGTGPFIVMANGLSVVTTSAVAGAGTGSMTLMGHSTLDFINSSINNFVGGHGIDSYGNLDANIGAGSFVKGASGVQSYHHLKLNNAGIIEGTVYGVNATTAEIVNSGTIRANTETGAAINLATSAGAPADKNGYILNNGTIANTHEYGTAIRFAGGHDTLENYGSIRGYVYMGEGYNKVLNYGTMRSVNLGGMNDSVTNNGFIYVVSLGDGGDAYFGEANGSAIVYGDEGGDYLVTQSGREQLYGGVGDDEYGLGTLTNVAEIVHEYANEGTDTIGSAISRNLADFVNVEGISLYGELRTTATGNSGANVLSGTSTAAVNTLRGLGGNDSYRPGLEDIVDESIAGSSGTDTVYAGTPTYSLSSANIKGAVENLTFQGGSAPVSGTLTGNALGNVITVLQSRTNSATMTLKGLAGNDTYVVNSRQIVDETAAGSSGVDKVLLTGAGVITYTLSTGVEDLEIDTKYGATGTLTGNASNNVFTAYSYSPIDDPVKFTVRGLGGNDTYIGSGFGLIDESVAGSGGTDTVRIYNSFSLSDTSKVKGAVENLVSLDVAASPIGQVYVMTGNGLANAITATQSFATTLRGLAGNDTYIVGTGAIVDEAAAGSNGTDTVQSAFTVDLTNTTRFKGTIENVTLTGTSAVNAIAANNTVANKLTGNIKANVLDGKGGADIFVFNTAFGSGNIDTVKGYTKGLDKLHLDDAIFKGLGTAVEAAEFRKGAGITTAANADQHLIYNTTNGALYWDFDGNKAGGVAAVHFATLTDKPALDHLDFAIV